MRQACAEVADGDVVNVANVNAPGQVVVAGGREAVSRAGERARELGARRVMPLDVSAPFHCELMRPAEARLARDLRALVVADPAVPVVADVDAEPKRGAAEAVDALIRQVSAPVQWEAVVRRMAADGVTTFIEVGPGKVLSRLIRQTVPSVRVAQVSDSSEPRSGGGRAGDVMTAAPTGDRRA